MFNLLTMSDLTSQEIYQLIDRARQLKKAPADELAKNIYVSNLFFENSTRTKLSFEVAQRKLGMQVIPFEVTQSSVTKGESLYDTCETLASIGVNLLVIRHPQCAYYQQLQNLSIPIINGGDGAGHHPSQCLLDLMTIYEEFGRFKGLNIVIVGDIKNSRVANSNADTFKRLGMKVKLVSPKDWQLEGLGEYVKLDEVIDKIDVAMFLRVQHERHEVVDSQFSKYEYHKKYGLDQRRYNKLASHAIIMHPAPVNRDVEIASELVEAPKSRIFKQMTNGMFMRQAIIEFILKKNNLL